MDNNIIERYESLNTKKVDEVKENIEKNKEEK